jgi:hypothetical protein
MAKEEIKALYFGVKGLQRKKDIDFEKYKAREKNNLKVVKTKTKINSELRRQLLKNYGFSVEPKYSN